MYETICTSNTETLHGMNGECWLVTAAVATEVNVHHKHVIEELMWLRNLANLKLYEVMSYLLN